MSELENYKPLPDNPLVIAHPGGTHPRMVASPANIAADGTIFLGIRHYCPLMSQNIDAWQEVNGICKGPMKQGYVDQHGTFMDRKLAMKVAVAQCQVKRSIGYDGDDLFSEHLY